MALFESTYQAVIKLAKHRSAHWYLYTLSLLESFIVPFPPPDVLLAPLSLANPDKALRYALGTTISSVLGGIIGFTIGFYAFAFIEPYVISWGYEHVLQVSMSWFKEWGFWAVLIAGFSPVPYKIFTISAGALSLAFLPFIFASIIGRGARFYLVAYVLSKFGPDIEPLLLKYIERIGWAIVVAFVIVVVYFKVL
ncbi:MAG: DedA family protein [Gammaproteobacteria bacterium]|nr:DedA family protein [Gammaproteobacteria bacterium]